MAQKVTHEQFEMRVNEWGNGEYKLLSRYTNSKTKVTLVHKCGCKYKVTPNNFQRGTRCPKCTGHLKTTKNSFLKEVKSAVGSEYKLIGDYKDIHTKVVMEHGDCGFKWEITPKNFLQRKARCPKCRNRLRFTTEEYAEQIRVLYDDEYKVLGEYKNGKTKILMLHSTCGTEFEVSPNSIKRGSGCPSCAFSKGEKAIEDYLIAHGYDFKSQHSFDDLRGKYPYKFDFALFDGNEVTALIEYDGEQHFKPIEHFGGVAKYRNNLSRDKKKNEYCKSKEIPLIRIPYFTKDIDKELQTKLNQLKVLI